MDKLIECVPNYSEGRDKAKIEQIVDCFRGKKGVKLLFCKVFGQKRPKIGEKTFPR